MSSNVALSKSCKVFFQGRRSWQTGCLLGLLLLLGACGNRVVLPDAPEDPVRVYLIDHGRHPSLVLPAENNGWVRYAHGEWRWYAKLEQGLLRGLQSLFWPTRGTLGRQTLAAVPQQPGFSAAIPEGYRMYYRLEVERDRVTALRERLDAYFEAPAEAVFQPAFNLEFVPYSRFYWFGNNSNRTMVAWLRALDVSVTGLGLFSQWHLVSQEDTGFDLHGTGRTDVVCLHGGHYGRGGDQLCAAE